MKKNRKAGLRKERIIMLAASVFILTALTMTGIYVNQRNNKDNDQNRIDLNELNQEIQNQTNDVADQLAELQPQNPGSMSDDLDVEINYEEVNTSDVVLPVEDQAQLGQTGNVSDNQATETGTEAYLEEELTEISSETVQEPLAGQAGVPEVELHFTESETLAWPIVGNVLLNYSMNEVVYYKTLNQYRYNPSIVIEATVGEPITAAADGKILSIKENVETGGTIVCDLGDGYELTCGQLENYKVSEGDYVEKGDILGFVAEPSIFYVEEGSNVYFKLTRNGEPVDPMNVME